MARESIHKKLSRVRKPRVHITYDVQVGDAQEQKELPFVVGVMADLTGQPSTPLPRVKDRKFVEIDRDNFNDVLGKMSPQLQYKVANRLTDKEGQLGVNLQFRSMDDFGPEAVASQVPELHKLVEARQRLHELTVKMTANDKLDELLQEVMRNTGGRADSGSQREPEGEK